jgi:hypothetical protein
LTQGGSAHHQPATTFRLLPARSPAEAAARFHLRSTCYPPQRTGVESQWWPASGLWSRCQPYARHGVATTAGTALPGRLSRRLGTQVPAQGGRCDGYGKGVADTSARRAGCAGCRLRIVVVGDVGSDGAPDATQTARTLVQSMLLKDGELADFHLEKVVPESVKDDLPAKGIAHYTDAKRLVTDNWVASAHSILLRSDGKVPLVSTSNIFRSDDATRQIWTFWGSAPHGVTVRSYRAPGGPAGARLQWATDDQHAAFEVSWVQGRVISAVLLGGHPHERFTKAQLHRITLFLVNAANAQAKKVENLSPLL